MSIDIGDNGRMEFTYQFSDVHPVITVRLSPQSAIPEVLEAFEGFLKAAGYVFNGEIVINYEEPTNENSVV